MQKLLWWYSFLYYSCIIHFTPRYWPNIVLVFLPRHPTSLHSPFSPSAMPLHSPAAQLTSLHYLWHLTSSHPPRRSSRCSVSVQTDAHPSRWPLQRVLKVEEASPIAAIRRQTSHHPERVTSYEGKTDSTAKLTWIYMYSMEYMSCFCMFAMLFFLFVLVLHSSAGFLRFIFERI